MNVALLALLPLALAGFAAGAFAEAWLRALAAALPSEAPVLWSALPPMFVAAGLGAWLAGRRAGRAESALRESSLWLAAAAAGALLAPVVLQWLVPSWPVAAWHVHGAEWLGALPFAAGCGGALALVVEARARAGRPAAVAAHAALALPAVAACVAVLLRPGAGGADASAQLLPAAIAAVSAAVIARILGDWEGGTRVLRADSSAPVGWLDRIVGQLGRAVGGAVLATALLLAGRLDPSPLARALVMGGLCTGLAVQLLLGESLGAWLRAPRDGAGRRPLGSGVGLRLLLLALAVAWLCRVLAAPSWEARPFASALAAVAAILLVDLALARIPPAGASAAPSFGRIAPALLVGAAAALLAFDVASADGEAPRVVTLLRLLLAAGCATALLTGLATRASADGRAAAARWLLVVVAGLSLAATLAVSDERLLPRPDPPEGRVLERQEGLRHVDTLVGLPGGRALLRRDGAALLDDDVTALLARRVGRLAAALAPAAQSAALLLRDDGHVLAALAASTPARVTCVEPDAALVVLQPELSYEAGQEPRGGLPRLVVDDPRAWLLEHPRELDLIVGNLFRPAAPGAEGWLTAEHFLALRGALREGGVAVVAVPLERLPWPAFEHVGAAFLQAFPDARLFVTSLRADVPIALLAGGLSQGVPGSEALDALLAASPSVAGPNGAPDVFDLYVCDGWTLAARWREVAPATLAQPWGAWLSAGREGDSRLLARLGLRLLADLAVPLETSSLQARPVADKDDRRLGAELTARSAALVGLLGARSAQLALDAAAPGELSDEQRDELDSRIASSLLFAWHAAPGHLDVRDALLERANALALAGREDLAGGLLESAVAILPDPRMQGVLGGLLLRLGEPERALTMLREARGRAPEDRNVLINLAAALLLQGDDAAGHAELEAALRASPSQALPSLPAAALGLLRGEVGAVAPSRALVESLPAGDPWATVLRRLLRLPPAATPPR